LRRTKESGIEGQERAPVDGSSLPRAKREATLTRKVARGGAIALAGQGLTRIVSFCLQLILSNALGIKVYGVYSLAVNLVEWAQQISLLGLTNGLVRFSSAYIAEGSRQRVRDATISAGAVSLVASLLGVGLLLSTSGPLAEALFHDPSFAPHLRWLSLSVPVVVSLSLLQALMRGLQRIDKMVALGLARSLIYLALVGLLAKVGLDLGGVIAAFIAGALAPVFLGLITLRRMGWKILGGRPSLVRDLLAFSIPIFVATLSQLVVARLDLLILGYFYGAQSAGLYRAAVTVASMVNFILGAMNTAFAPMIAELHHLDRRGELESMYKTVTRWILMVAVPVCSLVLILSKDLLRLFGKGFEEAYVALGILSISQLCNAATGSVGFMLQMTGKEKWFLFNYVVSAILNVSLNLLLVPSLGVTGAAIATGASVVLVNGLGSAELWFSQRIHPWSKWCASSVAAAGVSALGGVLMQLILGNWIVTASTVTLAYLFMVFTVAAPREDRDLFIHFLSRARMKIKN
jgi:O-antigen/teichoic acid export membrane protein